MPFLVLSPRLYNAEAGAGSPLEHHVDWASVRFWVHADEARIHMRSLAR